MAGKRYLKWDGFNGALAVFAVLFLLLMLSPVFEVLIYPGHHDTMRLVSCQSNMKQLGLAMEQYTEDNNGALPPSMAPNGARWREAIYPFVKSVGVYQCPRPLERSDYTASNLPRSYAVNHVGPDSRGQERGAFATASESPVMLTQLSQPNKTVLLCDTQGSDASEWNIVSPAFLPSTGRKLYIHAPRHVFYERPDGTLNCLFADNHVKRLKPMATLAPINLWARDNAPFTGQDLDDAQAILKHAEDE